MWNLFAVVYFVPSVSERRKVKYRMKAFMKSFGIITMCCVGLHSASAQEPLKNELAKVEYQQRTSSDIAKLQTQNLQESLKLDDSQALKVYEVMLEVEQKMEAITNSAIVEDAKMAEIGKWATLKTKKLKEILTIEQFSFYINTIKSNKR